LDGGGALRYAVAMSMALRQSWTRERFFAWAEAQEGRYEFDGFQPVAMVGGTMNHSQISLNIQAALRQRLRGTRCRPLGQDAGVATIGHAVRYPDAVVSCSKIDGLSRLLPEPVVIFEVLSESTGRTDRITKVREYAAIPSLRRYVIVEAVNPGLLVLERKDGVEHWTARPLTAEDTLVMPEIGIEIPVAEFYEDVAFSNFDTP
jgi:Uma2 family endonuclease